MKICFSAFILYILIFHNPSLANSNLNKQQLIDRYTLLAREHDLLIEKLKSEYSKCDKICNKKKICDISLDTLDVIREYHDILHELYYVYNTGYLSWVEKSKMDVKDWSELHYKRGLCEN